MGSGEPALVPEWYRAAQGARAPNANSDDNGVGHSLRSRIPLVPFDLDSKGTSRRNGSVRSDKNSSPASRAYSNFGRRDKKKNLDSRDRDRDRDRPLFSDVGSHTIGESTLGSRTDRDRSWRNDRGVSDRHREFWPSRPDSDSKGVVIPRENASGGITRPSSFKREFPTLASVQKKVVLDAGRVSTPVQSLPLPSSTVLVGDSWTSALAEVPSAMQTALVSPASLPRSNSNGLNMAEALILASSQVQTSAQLSGDTSKTDELVLKQCKQLIPVTPSMPKIYGLNTLEKPKVRASRMGDFGGPPKSSQLSSQLLVNHASCAAATKSDAPKSSQIGNLQVLSRERTGVNAPTVSKDVVRQDVSVKSSINANSKPESKGTGTTLLSSSKMTMGYFGEKRPISLAQKRNDFFDSIRKKTSVNNSSAAAIPEPSCDTTMLKSLSLDQSVGSCDDFSVSINQEENHGDGYCSDSSAINQEDTTGDSKVGCADDADASQAEKQVDRSEAPEDDGENKKSSCCSDCKCHTMVDLDERDKAFLRKLGWTEDATEEALTEKEIADFIILYQKKRPYSKFSERLMAARKFLHVPSLSVAQTS